MPDSLKIWGTDYTGVKGFKASDTSDNQYAYVRPQGTKSITQNGNNIDVSEYASASVNVDRTGGHVTQEGSSIVIPADEVDSGWTTVGIADGTQPSGAISFTSTVIATEAFRGKKNITSVNAICTQYTSNATGTGWFYGCTGLETAVIQSSDGVRLGNEIFRNCTSLQAIDLRTASGHGIQFAQNVFNGCSSLTTLILRGDTIYPLWGGTGNLTGTPFASGGTGGIIYIPKSLYDHLGDGTSNDYKNATNWSVVDAYGTITWAKIEGSYYETHYADGTEIPSA